ncbi:phage portal protein [Paracidovorax oryzae]|uniref:phage portal protein n=1 Tax=Paracidovorax oryzae TaxID=862720 RepID=UPI0035CEEF46
MRPDLKALADVVVQAVRATLAPLKMQLREIDDALKALPATVTKDLDQRVQAAVSELPFPKDGKDADPDAIAAMVAKAVAELPPAKDGAAGASVTLDDVAPLVADEVAKAVAVLPRPKDGEPGTSVTPEDVEPMVAEMVQAAVAEIPRPKDGESVPVGEVQRMVDEAVSKAMASVAPPKDGAPGRDALQLELQPAIDLEKAYPRGTYARHAGGLWRAFEATKGLHGWECVVDGIAHLEIEQDGREFTLVAKTSSGDEVRKSVKVAALVDRGVFKAGAEYEAGDGVTWGGSFFIAQKDGPRGHPGEPGCDGWRLAVKRGRDGTKGISV